MVYNGTNHITLRGINNVKIKSVFLHYILEPLIQPALCFPHKPILYRQVQGRKLFLFG